MARKDYTKTMKSFVLCLPVIVPYYSSDNNDNYIITFGKFHRAQSLTDGFSRLLRCFGMVTRLSIIPTAQRMHRRLIFDRIIMKLLPAILSFSIMNCALYSNNPPMNLSNVEQVLHTQNRYVDFLWRYLVYRCTYEEAVKCFF